MFLLQFAFAGSVSCLSNPSHLGRISSLLVAEYIINSETIESRKNV